MVTSIALSLLLTLGIVEVRAQAVSDDPVVDFFLRHPGLMPRGGDATDLVCEVNGDPRLEAALNYLRESLILWSVSTASSAGVRCDDLFSESVPVPLQPLWQSLPGRAAPWRPFCSLHLLRQVMSEYPTASPDLVREIHDDVSRHSDGCTDDAERGRVSRFVAASRAGPIERIPSVTSSTARESSRSAVHALVGGLVGTCCDAEDMDCRSYFGSLEVRFCDEERNRVRRRECRLYHAMAYHVLDRARLERDEAFPVSRFEHPVIWISPSLRDSHDVAPAVVHEGHHVCSRYHWVASRIRGLDWYDTRPAVIGAADGECSITAENSAHFRGLWSRQGLNEASMACLFRVGGRARESIALPPTRCLEHCPAVYLEEAYAEISAMIYEVRTQGTFDRTTVCNSRQDASHPLPASVLSCLLLTPSLRAEFITASGCVRAE